MLQKIKILLIYRQKIKNKNQRKTIKKKILNKEIICNKLIKN
jgi:hypothetical protein